MILPKSLASFLLIAVFLTIARASNNDQQKILVPTASSSRRWDFNFSFSAPHYFASVQGLTQQWPNTFFPNGHSIVPCEIPPYTKLYHARTDPDLPESPEWLSFDIEMAYGIMGSTRNSHMLTYQTTRSTKAIYFDGESANLMGAGSLDTQMLQIYLNTSGAAGDKRRFGLWEEYDRASGLCTWINEKELGGSGWGFEGIIRMNAGFEMIWCNFTSPTIKLVSHLNVTAPLLRPEPAVTKAAAAMNSETSYFPLPPIPTKPPVPADPMPPPNWRRDSEHEPFLRTQGWDWFTSATDHYGFSGLGPGYGETRIKPLTCAVLNYYDPIFESQALARGVIERKALNLTAEGLWIGAGGEGEREVALKQLMRRRRSHRLDGVSVDDAAAMRTASETAFLALVNGTAKCSGLDWSALTNEIVQLYATDLFNFKHLLSALETNLDAKNETDLRSAMTEIRGKSHSFLLPFLEYPKKERNRGSKGEVRRMSARLERDTYARCRYHHTRLLTPEFNIHLNPQEHTLKQAVEITFGGICTYIIRAGFGIEEMWQNMEGGVGGGGEIYLAEELRWWREGLEELMAWLGWAGNWVRCEKLCEWDEKCFIPMWPLVARNRSPGGGGRPPPPPDDGGPDHGDDRPPPPPDAGGPNDGPPNDDLPPPPEDNSQDSFSASEPLPPRSRPPYYGHERRPGRGGRRGPGWMFDDTDLWEPKCVKADYIMG